MHTKLISTRNSSPRFLFRDEGCLGEDLALLLDDLVANLELQRHLRGVLL